VRRISNRREKQFDPTERDGRVDFLMNEHELDLTEGSWTLMARTNRKMHSWAEQLRADGYLYSKKGKSSINRDMAEVVVSWRQLQRGGALT